MEKLPQKKKKKRERNGEGRTCKNLFCSRLRLSSSLQFGIGWDEQNGLSQGIYIYSTRTYFPRPTCTKYITCYVIKLEKHNLIDQKVHSAKKKKKHVARDLARP